MAAHCGMMASRPLLRYLPRFERTPVANCGVRPFSKSSLCRSNLRNKLAVERQHSPWTLMAAVYLQRPPVISADLNPVEQRFAQMMQQMELEKSILCEHELRLLEDAERLRRRQADDYNEDEDDDGRKEQDIVLTQDLEDEWERKLKTFSPAARVTDVDKDLSSSWRLLSDSLVLLSEQQVGSTKLWLLPQAQWRSGETLRHTAERALACLTEPALKATFLGQAPCGVYKYKLPKTARSDTTVGSKIFFFKAILTHDSTRNAEPNGSIMWLSKRELQRFLKPAYMMKVERFILGP
ncbi:39S ribosomal protein L46, mitochondrial [Phycodurus eques]|uniref:39S ribosomal protein L46, mitochondrial n=1 Tax=Phycodurus eques TaxID=693459 RepID=UPI002ACD3215|nr:39S ribosomal protein L46, mitochondrial [Phycodurus eques]